jgi:PmbA protein
MSTDVSARGAAQLSYSQQDLQDLVTLALAEARGLGASDAEVGVSVETGLSVTARLREVETLEYQRDRGMGVTVYRGKRKGSASTGDLSATAIRDSVAKAFSIAGFTAEDESAGLPEPDTLARDFPDLDLFHPWSVDPDEARELAIACEAAALDADARIGNSEGATLSTHRGMRVFGNHAAQPELRSRRRVGRRNAARLLVQHRARLARPRRRRQHR